MTARRSRLRRRDDRSAPAFACAGLAVGMVGLAFASVPLYDAVLQGDRLRRHAAPGAGARRRGVATDDSMVVHFDTNVAPGLPWQFKPESAQRRGAARRDQDGVLPGEEHRHASRRPASRPSTSSPA